MAIEEGASLLLIILRDDGVDNVLAPSSLMEWERECYCNLLRSFLKMVFVSDTIIFVVVKKFVL